MAALTKTKFYYDNYSEFSVVKLKVLEQASLASSTFVPTPDYY